MKVGDLVMRRAWVGEGILVGESGGEWVGTGDVGIIVGFHGNFRNSPTVMLRNGGMHWFTRESLQVLSSAIVALPCTGAPPARKANSAEKFPVE
jgi:hypothetical protein